MSTETLLHWLLRTSLEGGALVSVVLAARWVMGSKLTPGWRVALWSLVALKLLLPASLPTIGIGSFWSDRVAVTEGSRGLQSTGSVSKSISSSSDEGTRPLNLSMETGSGVATRHVSSFVANRGLKSTTTFLDRYTIIFGAWMLGAMTMLGVVIVREARFRRALACLPQNVDRRLTVLVHDIARALRLARAPRILITEASTVPAVAGLTSPVLLMPQDWQSQLDTTELDSILRHELLHLKHHDLFWNWCATLVNALHWFNPLVWIAVARCQEDRELRCDERALAIAEPSQRIAYGRVLLRLQEHFISPPAIAGIAPCVRNHPPLRQRILMITQPNSTRPLLHACYAVALGLLIAVSFGSAKAQDEKPGRTREGERSREAEAPRKVGDGKGMSRKGAADGMKKPGARDGEGAKKSAEGDGAVKKAGARDGEGAKKSAEGDGARKKTGARDGEGAKKSAESDGASRKTGARDGEGTKKSGARDGEGSKKFAEGARDGVASSTGKVVLHITEKGESVMVNGEKIETSHLRAHLSEFLPNHQGEKVTIGADDDVPSKVVAEVLDAARDNGAKKATVEK
jgi:beta-lactamase regulating signal transducer with metallopeptidase domain